MSRLSIFESLRVQMDFVCPLWTRDIVWTFSLLNIIFSFLSAQVWSFLLLCIIWAAFKDISYIWDKDVLTILGCFMHETYSMLSFGVGYIFHWFRQNLCTVDLSENLSSDMKKDGIRGRTLTLKLKTSCFEVWFDSLLQSPFYGVHF